MLLFLNGFLFFVVFFFFCPHIAYPCGQISVEVFFVLIVKKFKMSSPIRMILHESVWDVHSNKRTCEVSEMTRQPLELQRDRSWKNRKKLEEFQEIRKHVYFLNIQFFHLSSFSYNPFVPSVLFFPLVISKGTEVAEKYVTSLGQINLLLEANSIGSCSN